MAPALFCQRRQCAAEAGRQARQATGEVTEGTDLVMPIGPFQLQLRSGGEDGWIWRCWNRAASTTSRSC